MNPDLNAEFDKFENLPPITEILSPAGMRRIPDPSFSNFAAAVNAEVLRRADKRVSDLIKRLENERYALSVRTGCSDNHRANIREFASELASLTENYE